MPANGPRSVLIDLLEQAPHPPPQSSLFRCSILLFVRATATVAASARQLSQQPAQLGGEAVGFQTRRYPSSEDLAVDLVGARIVCVLQYRGGK